MKNIIKFLALAPIIILSSCERDDPDPKDNNNEAQPSIELSFNLQSKGMDIVGTEQMYTQSGDTFNLGKLKYLISGVTLEKENGEFYTIPSSYAYISMLSGRTSVKFKDIPKGKYKSIRFMVGLDSLANHGDPLQWAMDHPLAPSLNDMHWGWAGGYIFNVFEGEYMKNGKKEIFNYHVATLKNRRTHSFIQNFEINKDIKFTFDIQTDKYFDNQVNFSIKNDGAVSHSGEVDPIMDKLMMNMIGVFELGSVE